MKIAELAKMADISVRTLQYYDRIGLLKAAKLLGNGYRDYGEEQVDRLQEILLFREMGLELKEIAAILDANAYERLQALKLHRAETRRRLKQMRHLLDNIDGSIKEMEEGINMKQKDKFKGMDFRTNPYEAEAREKWGNGKVDEANATMAKKTDEDLGILQAKMNEIFSGFAALRGTDPKGPQAVKLSEQFHQLLNNQIGNFYDKEVFKGLGAMYIDDERFTKNLDKWGEGTALFMRDAMAYYSDVFL